MIYTVTFNPSLDYIVRLEKFTAGAINRVSYEQVLGGGKGITLVSTYNLRPTAIYTLDGRYCGNDLQCLRKGLYIVNGKKIVVK